MKESEQESPSSLEWAVNVGPSSYPFVFIEHRGDHIAYNPRKIGLIVFDGAPLAQRRVVCARCHRIIPLEVLDRFYKLKTLIGRS